MPKTVDLSRRRLIGGLGAGGAGLLLGGCDRFNASPTFRSILSLGRDCQLPSPADARS